MTRPEGQTELLRFEQLVLEPAQGRLIEASGILPAGGVLVVSGPSGAGKSTLLRALARLIPIVSGEVWLRGRPMASFPATLWRQQVHYLPQRTVAFDGTVLDNLLVPFRLRAHRHRPLPSRSSLLAALQRLRLTHGDQDARTLSGGELARVSLLRAVMADPAVLLLDEPTAALDPETRRLTLEFLLEWLQGGAILAESESGDGREYTRGIVLVSHIEEDVRFFDSVVSDSVVLAHLPTLDQVGAGPRL